MNTIKTWQDRIWNAHPSSDSQYWPDELMFKYAKEEVIELRKELAREKAQTVEPVAKVGNSKFESWYSETPISHERKQAIREAYEAGMNDKPDPQPSGERAALIERLLDGQTLPTMEERKSIADMLAADSKYRAYCSEYANVQANEALRYQKRIRDLEAVAQQVAVPQVLESLLRKPVKHVSELGPCHCPPGICQAPVIMGQRAMCLRNIGSKP